MKNICKRVVLIFLCLVMIGTTFPITVSATNNYKLSDAGARMIQSFEGFAKYPVWDYAQYSVGYGSRCPDADYERYMANGITEAEADALFRNHIKSHENRVNNFANKYNLELTQNQFDALVSFSYNVGAGWMSHEEYGITQAVINGETGSDFLFAIVQWCNAGGKILTGLVKRRFVEANIYLNGEYSSKIPENYKYVIFNHKEAILPDGELTTYKIQAYDAAEGALVVPVGYKKDYRFLGWYTEETNGAYVEVLDDTLEAGQKLYARWQDGDGNVVSNSIISGTPALYSRTAASNAPVYKNPTIWSSTIGNVAINQKLSIISDYVNKAGVKWGRISDGGWIELSKTNADVVLYTVQDESVAVARTIDETKNSEKVSPTKTTVGMLVGADIYIYETVIINKQTWGNTDLGWLCLDYIDCVLW